MNYTPTRNTIIGVSLAVVGVTVQSGGFVLQKLGHNQVNADNTAKHKYRQTSVLTKCVWWLGIIIYSVGYIMHCLSLFYATQSMIVPVSALNVLTITIRSPLSIKCKDIIATFILVIGISMVVIFGPTQDTNLDIDDIRDYFKGKPFIITIASLTVITGIVYVGIRYAEYKNFESDANDDMTYGRNWLLLSYIWVGCFFASNNTLFIKATMSVIVSSRSISYNSNVNVSDYLLYIIIGAFVILLCVLSMEYFRQKALSHFGAVFVVPIFSATYIILSAMLGMIFFEEYNDFTMQTAALFSLGILITVCGVFALSFKIYKTLNYELEKYIKVALIDYNQTSDKYAQTVVYGGLLSEYYQQYFYKRPAVCYDQTKDSDEDWKEMEQMVAKSVTTVKK